MDIEMEEKPEINRVPVKLELETRSHVALSKVLEEQADWVRAIVRDEIAKWEKRQLHARRFGKPYPDKETK